MRGFKINKNKIWKKITKKFNSEHNEMVVFLTSKLKESAICYAEGYSKCLESMVEEPYRPEDIEEHLFEVIVDYIIEKINNG